MTVSESNPYLYCMGRYGEATGFWAGYSFLVLLRAVETAIVVDKGRRCGSHRVRLEGRLVAKLGSTCASHARIECELVRLDDC